MPRREQFGCSGTLTGATRLSLSFALSKTIFSAFPPFLLRCSSFYLVVKLLKSNLLSGSKSVMGVKKVLEALGELSQQKLIGQNKSSHKMLFRKHPTADFYSFQFFQSCFSSLVFLQDSQIIFRNIKQNLISKNT